MQKARVPQKAAPAAQVVQTHPPQAVANTAPQVDPDPPAATPTLDALTGGHKLGFGEGADHPAEPEPELRKQISLRTLDPEGESAAAEPPPEAKMSMENPGPASSRRMQPASLSHDTDNLLHHAEENAAHHAWELAQSLGAALHPDVEESWAQTAGMLINSFVNGHEGHASYLVQLGSEDKSVHLQACEELEKALLAELMQWWHDFEPPQDTANNAFGKEEIEEVAAEPQIQEALGSQGGGVREHAAAPEVLNTEALANRITLAMLAVLALGLDLEDQYADAPDLPEVQAELRALGEELQLAGSLVSLAAQGEIGPEQLSIVAASVSEIEEILGRAMRRMHGATSAEPAPVDLLVEPDLAAEAEPQELQQEEDQLSPKEIAVLGELAEQEDPASDTESLPELIDIEEEEAPPAQAVPLVTEQECIDAVDEILDLAIERGEDPQPDPTGPQQQPPSNNDQGGLQPQPVPGPQHGPAPVAASAKPPKGAEPEKPDWTKVLAALAQFLDDSSTIWANLNNEGKENTGFNAIGGKSAWGSTVETSISGGSPDRRQNERTDPRQQGPADAIGGLAQMGGGILQGFNAWGAFVEAVEKGEHEKAVIAAMDLYAGAMSAAAGTVKVAYGTSDAINGATITDDPRKFVGDAFSITAELTELLASGVQGGFDLYHMLRDKHWKDQSASTIGSRIGNGGLRTAKVMRAGAKVGTNIWKLDAQAKQGFNAIASSSAQSTATMLGTTVFGPASAAFGLVEMGRQGHKAVNAGLNRSKLTKQVKGMDPDHEREQIAALEHLRQIQKKKQARTGIDGGLAALGVVSAALVISGYGAIPGLAIGGFAAATKGTQLGMRFGKQKARDHKAKQYQELKAKAPQDLTHKERDTIAEREHLMELLELKTLLRSERKHQITPEGAQRLSTLQQTHGNAPSTKDNLKLAFSVDIGKSSTQKADRNLQTASTILDWDANASQTTAAERLRVALRALGIDGKKWAAMKQEHPSHQDLLDAVLKKLKKR